MVPAAYAAHSSRSGALKDSPGTRSASDRIGVLGWAVTAGIAEDVKESKSEWDEDEGDRLDVRWPPPTVPSVGPSYRLWIRLITHSPKADKPQSLRISNSPSAIPTGTPWLAFPITPLVCSKSFHVDVKCTQQLKLHSNTNPSSFKAFDDVSR
ncbi:hypothetical protein CPB84DRAFT_1844527 [Gymnopilus junonius]|uniref:Uncharacterized protein n=1 Tax=Gymnopilus junonius TaxID=109634 RepID=A0A9P5NTR4_GYMJU|nr:hypothetical protein CPB84DRAFT_1844527 [Gymnopilus junonius]